MGRKLFAALLAALMLSATVLAAAPETSGDAAGVFPVDTLQTPDVSEREEEPSVPETPEDGELDAAETPSVPETPEEEASEAPEPESAVPDGPENEIPAAPEEAETGTGYFEADLIQSGSLTGPQTLPDEVSLLANEAGAMEALYKGMLAKQDSIDISQYGIPTSQIGTLYSTVVNDHPELFYVHTGYGYSYTSTNMVASLSPYYHDGRVINGRPTRNLKGDEEAAAFNAAVSAAMAQVKSGMTDLEKALVLHDYLVVNCGYNWAVATGKEAADMTVYSAYGALVDRDAVCQGYALAYKLLLSKAGISAITVSSNAMNHMWNLVSLGGEWYHVDATWDDPVPNFEGRCLHSYFLMSDETMQDSNHEHHGWTSPYVCTSKQYESGYAFNGSSWPLSYDENHNFYYIEGYSTYQVKRGPLDGTGAAVGNSFVPYMNHTSSGSYNPHCFGVVWLDGCLYYIQKDLSVRALSLQGYGEKTLAEGTISFAPSASSDGKYASGGDFLGLRYRNGKIEAYSCNHPDNCRKTFSPVKFDFPPEWEDAGNGILGLTAGRDQVGIQWSGAEAAGALYVAAYNSTGRIIFLQAVPVNLVNGLNLVDLGTEAPANVRLILAGRSGFRPLYAAKTA